jgi:hypothetical protein
MEPATTQREAGRTWGDPGPARRECEQVVRQDVGVAAASGNPGAPAAIRVPVTGGAPAVDAS